MFVHFKGYHNEQVFKQVSTKIGLLQRVSVVTLSKMVKQSPILYSHSYLDFCYFVHFINVVYLFKILLHPWVLFASLQPN